MQQIKYGEKTTNMKKFGSILASVVMLFAPALAQTSTWTIDQNHSTAEFTVRHLAISNVRGNFTKVTGTVLFDEKDITKSSVDAVIDAASVDTRVTDRDNHLKSPDFFDVAKFPTLTFKSKKIVKNGDKLNLIGDLTIHGVTKEVSLDLEAPTAAITDPWGNERRGFSASTKIIRQDYGLVWQGTAKTGELVVGDEVKIALEIELVKKK
jgi:polyisoprenoid-binding protein YceI